MVEYLKTLGEELGPSIQQIGGALQDALMPNRKYQVMLKESLAKNPELIGQLATIAKDNPTALEGVFGKGAGGFFSSLHETPDAVLKRSMTSATQGALKGKEDDAGRVALGLPTKQAEEKGRVDIEGSKLDNQGKKITQAGQITTNERSKIQLQRETAAAKFMASLPPEVRNDVMFRDLTGLLQVDYSKAQESAHSMDEAAPWVGKSSKDIRRAYKSGALSNSALQGLWDLNPNAMQMMLKDMESDEAWAMRAAMAKDAKTNRRLDIMGELYKETAKHASEIGVSPAALFESRYGYSPDDVVPNSKSTYKPEDVTAARTADEKFAKAKRAKAIEPALKAFKNLKDRPKSAGAAAFFNATADAAGLDLRVEMDEEPGMIWGTNKKYKYYSNGVELDQKGVDGILQGGGHSGVEPEAKPTTSDKELSQGSKALIDAAKKKGFSIDTIKSSAAYARLSPEEQQAVLAGLGK